MTPQEYLKFHEDLCAEAREISKRKNQDYSAPEKRMEKNDPYAIFGNFMQAERLNICTVEQGFMVRISDKLSRLSNLLSPGHQRGVQDESVRDTALDTINYLLLLLGYLKTKEKEAATSPSGCVQFAGIDYRLGPDNILNIPDNISVIRQAAIAVDPGLYDQLPEDEKAFFPFVKMKRGYHSSVTPAHIGAMTRALDSWERNR